MEIVAAILGSVVVVFIGAWVNNIVTWKVKNRIEALDSTYIYVLEHNQAFLEFCSKQKDKENIDNELIKILNKKIEPYINRGYLNCFIIDEIKAGILYKKIYNWHQAIMRNTGCYYDYENNRWNNPKPHLFNINNNEQKSDTVKEYEVLLNDVTDTIFAYRKEIISFHYILKQLFMNWGTLITVLTIVVGLLCYWFKFKATPINYCYVYWLNLIVN